MRLIPFRLPRQASTTNANPQNDLALSGSWTACVLASIAASLLIFSAGAQNVSYGWALGAVHSEFRAVVLALASLGATLLAPVCFAAVVTCVRKRSFGTSIVALILGALALLYAATCSLGFVAGSGDAARSEIKVAAESSADKRALAKAARDELVTLKGTRADIVERRSELTALLVELSKAKADHGSSASANPDSQARGVAFVLSAFGWRVGTADVGQWLNILTVMFLELAASLSLMIAAALYPSTRGKAAEAPPVATLPAEAPAPSKPAEAAVRPSRAAVDASRRDDDDPPAPPPPKTRASRKAGRPATVIPAEALEKLRKAGGRANGSIRGVGKLIGARSKTTAHRVLHQLAEAGLVTLRTSATGCSIALA